MSLKSRLCVFHIGQRHTHFFASFISDSDTKIDLRLVLRRYSLLVKKLSRLWTSRRICACPSSGRRWSICSFVKTGLSTYRERHKCNGFTMVRLHVVSSMMISLVFFASGAVWMSSVGSSLVILVVVASVCRHHRKWTLFWV